MDFRTLNRAQFLLNAGSQMSKIAGGVGEAGGALWKAVKDVGGAGHKAMSGAVGHLNEAGHPLLAAAAATAPVGAAIYGGKKAQDKYRMHQAIRAARRQGYAV